MIPQWLWPVRTGVTFFDVNTIFHLCFWIYMGSNFWFLKLEMGKAIALGVLLSYVWELFERYAEQKWPAIWQYPESVLNYAVSDPLTAVIGILFAYYALNEWTV